MTKIRKMVHVPSREDERVVGMKCDLCGRLAPNGEWASGSSDVAETELKYRSGWSYPDCGSGEEATFDVCPQCWTEKLVPWFREQGAEPTVESWDF